MSLNEALGMKNKKEGFAIERKFKDIEGWIKRKISGVESIKQEDVVTEKINVGNLYPVLIHTYFFTINSKGKVESKNENIKEYIDGAFVYDWEISSIDGGYKLRVKLI